MRILCVGIQKNEGPFLLEWIAHLQAVGVTDLLVYSNDCTDGSDALLDILDKAGVLTHIRHSPKGEDSVQWAALKDAWKHPLRKKADWAMVCDVDEFPAVKLGDGTLPGLISALPETPDAITMPWRLFGSNGQMRLEDINVTEQFRMAARPDAEWPVAATFFKTLFRLKGPFNGFGVHRPKQKNPEKNGLPKFVDGAGHPLPHPFVENTRRLSLFGTRIGRDLVEMNHYSLRSAESYLVKSDRGLPNRTDKQIDLAYWVERNFNEVQENAVDRVRARSAEARDKLNAISGVAAAHAATLDWHHARFDALVATEEGHRLFSRITLSQSSVTPPREQAREMVRWYQAVYRAKQAADA